MDLVLRFQEHQQHPYATCFLCRAYNKDFRIACLDFLQVPDSALDVGFSLQLKRLAEAAGDSEAARVAYLLADTTQRALELVFQASAASSLPVERAFAQTKRNEAPRLCHVSVASRNQLLRNFLREREALLAPLQEAEAALRKATKLRIQSLAWQQRSELVGRALGCVALEKKAAKGAGQSARRLCDARLR